MEVTLSGIVRLVRLVHLANAEYPMLVTLEGIVKLVRLLQEANDQASIVVTPAEKKESRIVTLVRLLQE